MKFIPQPKPKSLKRSLIKAVASSVVSVAFFGAAFTLSGGGMAEMVAPEQGEVQVDRPVAKGSPQHLIAKHDCWTGEAPKDMEGVVPGHVVAAKGDTPVYGGSRLVGQALSQIFEGEDHGLTVYGFCR